MFREFKLRGCERPVLINTDHIIYIDYLKHEMLDIYLKSGDILHIYGDYEEVKTILKARPAMYSGGCK